MLEKEKPARRAEGESSEASKKLDVEREKEDSCMNMKWGSESYSNYPEIMLKVVRLTHNTKDCDLSRQKLKYLGFFVFASLEEEVRDLSPPDDISHERIFEGNLAEEMGFSDLVKVCLKKYVELLSQLLGLTTDEDTIRLFVNYTLFYWLKTREILHVIEGKQDKEKEKMRPFAKEIREMEEMIEYVEREFRTEPAHIKLPD